jgi:hypothetical protein
MPSTADKPKSTYSSRSPYVRWPPIGDAHGPELAGPFVNILKEMVVDRAVVRDRESAVRQQLFGTREGHRGLEAFECIARQPEAR